MASYAMAQDVIVKKDGTSILSKIIEITSNEVKYKKYSNLEGPTFITLISEIQVINYENGEKEIFGENTTVNTSEQNTQITGFSYDQLESLKDQAQIEKDIKKTNKKAKRIKIIGWTIGGLVAAGGALLIAGGASEGGERYDRNTGKWEQLGPNGVYLGCGIGLVAAGAATTTLCILRANKIKKKNVLSINSAPIYEHDIHLKNGKILTAGLDVLHDNRQHSQTLGLGLRYSF